MLFAILIKFVTVHRFTCLNISKMKVSLLKDLPLGRTSKILAQKIALYLTGHRQARSQDLEKGGAILKE